MRGKKKKMLKLAKNLGLFILFFWLPNIKAKKGYNLIRGVNSNHILVAYLNCVLNSIKQQIFFLIFGF
jgi:hypothetical protein